MKKLYMICLTLVMMFTLSACAGNNSAAKAQSSASNAQTSAQTTTNANKKVLVAYFSRAGENHGVGVVEKGNTKIVAEMIAAKTGADLFEIEREKPYPAAYRATTDEAKAEMNQNARPTIKGQVENFAQYDIVFIGAPIWWGDAPMPVYTFVEKYDFSGKKVIPFVTHAGSGMGRVENSLRKALPNNDIADGLAITGVDAQNRDASVERDVNKWLKANGF